MKKFGPLAACLLASTIALATPASSAPLDAKEAQEQIKTLLAMPFATNLIGASAAPRFAWVEKRGGVRNILTSISGNTPKALTHFTKDDGTDLWGLAFSPNGKILAYVEGGDPEYPDDPSPNASSMAFGTRQIVHVILEDGKDIVMGEGWNPTFSPDGSQLAFSQKGTLFLSRTGDAANSQMTVRGSLTSLEWSPDGKTLVFTLDRGTHSLIGMWHVQEKAMNFLDPGLSYDSQPTFSPDGKLVAFVREHEPLSKTHEMKTSHWEMHVYDIFNNIDHVVWTPPPGQGARFFAPEGNGLLWADNSHLLFPWEGSGWMRLCGIDIQKSSNPHCMTPDKAEISSYKLSPDKKTLYYTSNTGNHDAWHAWKQSMGGIAPQRLTKNNEMETDIALAGTDIGLMVAGVTQPAHPVLVLPDQNEQALTDPKLPPSIHFVTPEAVTFQSGDGLTIHGQLFSPQGKTSTRHPALIFVHGGPQRQMLPAFNAMGYYSNAYIMNQMLAAQGYVVLSVNYRSGTGYGEAFRNAAGIGRQGASEYKDVLAAASYLKAQPDVDSKRIGIWGGSWGGYLTALALARNSDIFSAGADFHGVHDMTTPDKNGFSPEENHAEHELEWHSSPVADISHWKSPVMLVHGDDDYNVAFKQSALLSRMLTDRGIPYEEHSFPDERHAFLRTQNWLTAYSWMNDFFEQHLKK